MAALVCYAVPPSPAAGSWFVGWEYLDTKMPDGEHLTCWQLYTSVDALVKHKQDKKVASLPAVAACRLQKPGSS